METENLEHYVSQAHAIMREDPELNINAEPFTSPRLSRPPRPLVKGVKNRVLVYAGSFNPPHRGHEALISHAARCTTNLNVVGTIIVPIQNIHVEKKCPGKVIDFHDRVRLWRGEMDNLPDWRWVYDLGDYDISFIELVFKLAAKDGFELVETCVMGPDVFENWQPESDDTEILVSDVSRDACFVAPDGSLSNLPGCTPWQLVDPKTVESIRDLEE